TAFPAGTTAPTNVIVSNPDDVDQVRQALNELDSVASVERVEAGAPGVKLEVVLATDPLSTEAFELISELRTVAHGAAASEVSVGGPTAEEYDLRQASERDNRTLVPIALIVVTV